MGSVEESESASSQLTLDGENSRNGQELPITTFDIAQILFKDADYTSRTDQDRRRDYIAENFAPLDTNFPPRYFKRSVLGVKVREWLTKLHSTAPDDRHSNLQEGWIYSVERMLTTLHKDHLTRQELVDQAQEELWEQEQKWFGATNTAPSDGLSDDNSFVDTGHGVVPDDFDEWYTMQQGLIDLIGE